MVRLPRRLARFAREETGLSLVEAMIVMPILIMLLLGMVEFAVAQFQWNQTVKAMEIGARRAVVSSPLISTTAYDEFMSDVATLDPGDSTPSTIVVRRCGAGTGIACEAAQLNRLLTGGDGKCGVTEPNSLPGICDINSSIGAQHLRFTYTRAGLGYVGRPAGAVTTLRLEVVGLPFNFLFLNAMFPGSDFTIPAHPVTMTSEDLSNTA